MGRLGEDERIKNALSMLVFRDVRPCGLLGRTNVSQKNTASIFRTGDGGSMFLQKAVICLL
jgi:hypothetical protein